MSNSDVSTPLQIGITGGIGSGKSLVCRIFKCLKIPVYDSDHRAKALMTTDGILISGIKKEFGDLSYNADGTLNRQYLSDIVFADGTRVARLNALVHPRVAEDYAQWLSKNQHAPYVLKEAALLVESGSYKQLDELIMVVAPRELRIKRVMERDPHRSAVEIENIIARQMPDEEKMEHASLLIYNDESQLLIPQVLTIHEQLIRLAR